MIILIRLNLAICLFNLVLAFVAPSHAQDGVALNADGVQMPQNENPSRWSHEAIIATLPFIPPEIDRNATSGFKTRLTDFVLGPEVFSKAKQDLSDLRLFDSAGQTIPFALRYLRAQKIQQTISANEFNRDEPENGVHQVTLDLLQNDIQHNSIRVVTTGDNFRRSVDIDGGDDGVKWRQLVDSDLVRFSDGDKKFNIDTFEYANSRFRYIRVRVSPDPKATSADADKDPFEFREVSVLREVDLPGEQLILEANVQPRQASRSNSTPSSSWIIELGGENIPCDRIEVDIADKEFARDVTLQAEFPYGPMAQKIFAPIYSTYSSTWSRKTSDKVEPMIATFNEIQTSRLRLVVADYRNVPLTIRSVKFSAPVRQIVFAPSLSVNSEIRLFVGNPDADLPNYDFARNLPDQLVPLPTRSLLRSLETNPAFVPPPKPFLERFPWLIYVVLTTVIAALAVVIASLARTAITLHDSGSTGMVSDMSKTA